MTPEDFLKLLHTLPVLTDVFNPWTSINAGVGEVEGAQGIRSAQLQRYLEQRLETAKLLLVAEAPSCQGARWTGIAMTSERIMLGNKPGVPASSVYTGEVTRTSPTKFDSAGVNEMTASIVWGQLLASKVDVNSVVLWNALPVHPHRPGEPFTNRPPKKHELKACAHVLPAMLRLFRADVKTIAVGKVAAAALKAVGIDAPHVRHPAKGGATEFRAGVSAKL